MVEREASSKTYSWWWPSHIRTKQSKWLEQNLQDMEEIVRNMLKIIETDGESFVQRAQMYYQKRPELISHIEESFRAYRALTDRYDHLSMELQTANRTIASVFPERVPLSVHGNEEQEDEKDDDDQNLVPKVLGKDLLRDPSMFKKATIDRPVGYLKSGICTKTEAVEEVNKIRKEILIMKTEKEFVKLVYEHGCEKYWEIEDKIVEMENEVGILQDEFEIDVVVEEDNEGRDMKVDNLNDKFQSLKDEFISKHRSEEILDQSVKLEEHVEKRDKYAINIEDNQPDRIDDVGLMSETETNEKQDFSEIVVESRMGYDREENQLNRKQVVGEKILVEDYTSVLQDYKEVENELAESEKQSEDRIDDIGLMSEKESNEKQDLSEPVEESESGYDGEESQLNRKLEVREKILVEEYTSVLQDYKEVKNRLDESEKKSRNSIFDLVLQITELKNSIFSKDEEIKALRQKATTTQQENNPGKKQEDPLHKLSESFNSMYSYVPEYSCSDQVSDTESYGGQSLELTEDSPSIIYKAGGKSNNNNNMKIERVSKSNAIANIEEKFRSGIDELQEEHLEFWLKCSNLIHQIQKFQTSIQALLLKLLKVRDNDTKKQEGKDERPIIHGQLSEMHSKLVLWLEHNADLKDELQSRFSSLCKIQREILTISEKNGMSKYKVSKFQGEVINLKEENNKMSDDLRVGFRRVRQLRVRVEKTMERLDEEREILGLEINDLKVRHLKAASKGRVTLGAFLFGDKKKKKSKSFAL